MPKKTRAAQGRARNLKQAREKKYTVTVEDVPDEDNLPQITSNTLTPSEPPSTPIDLDAELLDIIGAFRGTAIVEDEPDTDGDESDLESDAAESDAEVVELSALEHFASVLQKAHNTAIAQERARESGRKRPKHYLGNSVRTQQRQRQTRRKLEAQGYRSVKEWLATAATASNRMEATETAREDLSENAESSVASSGFEQDFPNQRNEVPQSHAHAAQQEEEEESSDSEAESRPGHVAGAEALDKGDFESLLAEDCADAEEDHYKIIVERMLADLREGRAPTDDSEETSIDAALNQLNYKNFPALRRVLARLSVTAKNKKFDVFLRARVTAMAGALNLYLDSELSYTWREASLIVSKSQGHGVYHARNIRTWIHCFLVTGKLPRHRYHGTRSDILDDEDISMHIQFKLMERSKHGYIKAMDVVEIVASPEIQEKLEMAGVQRRKISERTGREWLKKFQWRYGRKKNGMYIDGHEREDIVEYRKKFIQRFLMQYAPRMCTWDNNGNECMPSGEGFSFELHGRPFRLILVTHDESTFYANDERKSCWQHADQKAVPQPKGEGSSVMVSDFLTSEWGRLRSEDGKEDARIFFKAGKNRDGYFDSDDLLRQVDIAMDIFEERTRGFATGLFLFDNAPSHQKRAPDALSARRMPKFPAAQWTHHKGGPKMRSTILPDGQIQEFYFPDDHPQFPGYFKGMREIIQERGLWPADQELRAQCEGFKCEAGRTDCCCRRLLYTQPDFVNQKSRLEEYITSRGHICDFYPKYHCELNFIEQYWGAVKYLYRSWARPRSIEEMEQQMVEALDSISLQQIRRYANRAARFMSAYDQGLTGEEANWAGKKYHGHRVLPPSVVAEIKQAFSTS